MDFPPTDWEAVFAFNPAILQSPRPPADMLQADPASNPALSASSALIDDLTPQVATEALAGPQDHGSTVELGVCSSCRQYVSPRMCIALDCC